MDRYWFFFIHIWLIKNAPILSALSGLYKSLLYTSGGITGLGGTVDDTSIKTGYTIHTFDTVGPMSLHIHQVLVLLMFLLSVLVVVVVGDQDGGKGGGGVVVATRSTIVTTGHMQLLLVVTQELWFWI